jgi:hypothetical protein
MRNCHGNVMSEAMALCNETPVILVNKVDQNWKGGGTRVCFHHIHTSYNASIVKMYNATNSLARF